MSYTTADTQTGSPQDTSGLKASIVERWNKRSATYDDAFGHGFCDSTHRTLWLDALACNAAPCEGLRVLDVGCGTGFISLLLTELGCSVTGVDLAPDMLARARAKAEAAGLTIDFRHGDAENPPFEAETFDLIVCRHLVWTLPDLDTALRNWYRLLIPGGRLMPVEGTWTPRTAGDRFRVWLANLLETFTPSTGYNRKWQAEYPGGAARLPFIGGVPAGTLAAKLEEAGFEISNIDSLAEIISYERARAPISRKPLYGPGRRYIVVAQKRKGTP
jgi:ubiquinone/menaquinone biosynthesis C-methylase UbiE